MECGRRRPNAPSPPPSTNVPPRSPTPTPPSGGSNNGQRANGANNAGHKHNSNNLPDSRDDLSIPARGGTPQPLDTSRGIPRNAFTRLDVQVRFRDGINFGSHVRVNPNESIPARRTLEILGRVILLIDNCIIAATHHAGDYRIYRVPASFRVRIDYWFYSTPLPFTRVCWTPRRQYSGSLRATMYTTGATRLLREDGIRRVLRNSIEEFGRTIGYREFVK